MIIIFILGALVYGYEDPSTCQLYNYLTHACLSCPTNTSPSTTGYCNCTGSFYPNPSTIGFNHADSCLDVGSTPSSTQVIGIYDRDGTVSASVVSCVGGYPNAERTQCIPCGPGKTYDSSNNRCVCSNSNFYVNGQACYQSAITFTNPFTQSTIQYEMYNKARVGCLEFRLHDECQILLNYCALSQYSSTNEFCILLNTLNSNISLYTSLPNPSTTQAPTDSLNIYASSITGVNTTTIKTKLQYMMIQYNKFGQIVDIKPFSDQLFPFPTTEEELVNFQSFGKNLLKQSGNSTPSSEYFFDIFTLDFQGKYVQVPVILNSTTDTTTTTTDTSYYKRITGPSSFNTITAEYHSVPPLRVPYIEFSSGQNSQITTKSTPETVAISADIPFIIYNIFLLIVFVYNFYKFMKYNPNQTNDPYYFFKALLIFLLMGLKYWAIGLWIFLFGTSAFIFCFFKFQQTVYLLLPDIETDWWSYYHHFMAVFYVQFGFMLFAVFLLIYDLGSTTDYFMIDWEKQKNVGNFDIGHQKKQASVWRKVLLVNELYQLTIARLINVEFVVLFSLLFLAGLEWINLQYQVPNTQNIVDSQSSTRNPVLAYFIITFVVFIIGATQYILKYLFKVWSPLPHENFIDLCSISNISIIIFDEALHGYYIHGMNPLGQAEGSLQYIDSIFEKQAKSYGKNRSFRNDDPDNCQVFEVVFPFEIRQAFQVKYKSRYLQKLIGKAYDTSILAKPIPDMLDENDYNEIEGIQNDMLQSFKYYLQGVKTSQFNVKQKTFLQKLINCPLDVELIGKLPIFFKDQWSEFTNVLMCGHEFIFLMNTINLINVFYIATQNIFLAMFITMVVGRLVLKNLADVSVKRNISKNTLIDDKFFN